MSTLVVDSSVAIKWLKPQDEMHVNEARALLEEHKDGRALLVAPSLLLLEVMNALRSHQATAEQMNRAVDLLLGLHIELVEPDAELLKTATGIAVGHSLTVYDALFAALAASRGCELVTADKKLIASGACRVSRLDTR